MTTTVSMRARPVGDCVAQLAAPRKAKAKMRTRTARIFLPESLLARRLRPGRQPPHAATLAVIVVYREVLRAAVVPDGKRARRPLHTAGELRPRLLLLQKLDERPALRFGHVLEADGVAAADEERLASGVGMRAHHRMLGLVLLGLVGVVHFHAADLAVHLGAPAAVFQRGAVHPDDAPN